VEAVPGLKSLGVLEIGAVHHLEGRRALDEVHQLRAWKLLSTGA
jgi:hypothetical protein